MNTGADPNLMIGLLTAGSTLIGTVLGWLLNQFSKCGKLKIYCTSWADWFENQDSYGGLADSYSFNDSTYYHYELELNLHNRGGEPQIMRDIRIVFTNGENDICISTPLDDSTKHKHSQLHYSSYSKLLPTNIPSKYVISLKLHDSINGAEKVQALAQTKRIYLRFKNRKGKTENVLIHEEDYSQYFEAHFPVSDY